MESLPPPAASQSCDPLDQHNHDLADLVLHETAVGLPSTTTHDASFAASDPFSAYWEEIRNLGCVRQFYNAIGDGLDDPNDNQDAASAAGDAWPHGVANEISKAPGSQPRPLGVLSAPRSCGSLPSKADKPRTRRARRFPTLEAWYIWNQSYPYPSRAEKQLLATSSNLSLRQVTTWFNNERARNPPKNGSGRGSGNIRDMSGTSSSVVNAVIIDKNIFGGSDPSGHSHIIDFHEAPLSTLAPGDMYSDLELLAGQSNQDVIDGGDLAPRATDAYAAMTPTTLVTHYQDSGPLAQPSLHPGADSSAAVVQTFPRSLALGPPFNEWFNAGVTSAPLETGASILRPSPTATLPVFSPFTGSVSASSARSSALSHCSEARMHAAPRRGRRRIQSDTFSPIQNLGAGTDDCGFEAAFSFAGDLAPLDNPTETPIMPESGGGEQKPTQYQCTFCHKKLCRTSWGRHERERHLPKRIWICLLHGFRALSLENATEPQCCVFCGEQNPGDEHPATCRYRLEECLTRSEAERTFHRREHLLKHFNQRHGIKSESFRALADRWGIDVEYTQKEWTCGFCGEVMGSWKARGEHITKHFREGRTMDSWDSCRLGPYELGSWVMPRE